MCQASQHLAESAFTPPFAAVANLHDAFDDATANAALGEVLDHEADFDLV